MHSHTRTHTSMFGLSWSPANAAPAILLTLLFLMFLLLFLTLTAQTAQGQSYQVLYNFTHGTDGAYPQAGLTMDRAGNLYGTAPYGGYSGPPCDLGGESVCGTVFMLSKRGPSWILTSLYLFTGGNDGASPRGGLLLAPNGTLYGTTVAAGGGGGGEGNCQYLGIFPLGCGTVFNLRPSSHTSSTVLARWTEITIYVFQGHRDGAYPLSGLVSDGAGNLYGTTSGLGESGNYGNVYELMSYDGGWSQSDLYSFAGGNDGSNPAAGVIFDKNGNLYGTTAYGGTDGYGTVFELKSSNRGLWTENIL